MRSISLNNSLKCIFVTFLFINLILGADEDFEDTRSLEEINPDCIDYYDSNKEPILKSECLELNKSTTTKRPPGTLFFFDNEPRDENLVKEFSKHHLHKRRFLESLKGYFVYLALLLTASIAIVTLFILRFIWKIQRFRKIEELAWRIRNENMFTSNLSDDEEELVSRV